MGTSVGVHVNHKTKRFGEAGASCRRLLDVLSSAVNFVSQLRERQPHPSTALHFLRGSVASNEAFGSIEGTCFAHFTQNHSSCDGFP